MNEELMKATEAAITELTAVIGRLGEMQSSLQRLYKLAEGPQGSRTCAACGHVNQGPAATLNAPHSECASCHTLFATRVDASRLAAPVITVAEMYGVHRDDVTVEFKK